MFLGENKTGFEKPAVTARAVVPKNLERNPRPLKAQLWGIEL